MKTIACCVHSTHLYHKTQLLSLHLTKRASTPCRDALPNRKFAFSLSGFLLSHSYRTPLRPPVSDISSSKSAGAYNMDPQAIVKLLALKRRIVSLECCRQSVALPCLLLYHAVGHLVHHHSRSKASIIELRCCAGRRALVRAAGC